MPLDLKLYVELCNAFSEIDLFHVDSDLLPDATSESKISALITNGGAFVPRAYRQDYVQRLLENLPAFMIRQKSDSREMADFLEPFCAALYQHDPGATKANVRPHLRRFLAVVSNLYRSFTSEKKRKSIDVPIVTEIPPLAFFQSHGNLGPYTLTSEMVHHEIGTAISVVSLPQSYREHPIIWSSLTHEVCGHDVVHADEQLVPELVAAIRALFSPQGFDPYAEPVGDNLNALIWSYWIDEAVADVYGALNMGPTFALNLSAFLYAFLHKFYIQEGIEPPPAASLRTASGTGQGDRRMDSHPTDILRLHLAIGVIESMSALSSATRKQYIELIKGAATLAANGASTVDLTGDVQISHSSWRNINVKVPLAVAQDGARRAGALIATTRLQALGNHSVQDIETWDDDDERTAVDVADRILSGKSIAGAGDDAQLLAGATIAVLTQTGIYQSATDLLNTALDDSYNSDPVWQGLSYDLMVDRCFVDSLVGKPGKASKKKSHARKPRKTKKKG
jgi:hypothetical protein